MPVLSFCIPTYNRDEKIFNLVISILNNTTNQDFEIVVLDNCSTDNTFNFLKSIIDKRLIYIKNDFPLIGPLNIIQSLRFANGKYAFLCLDKDFISTIFIEELIQKLNVDIGLSFGFCKLNLKVIESDSFYDKGSDSLLNMAYLSSHPTGMFYNTQNLKSINLDQLFIDKNKIFGFYPDLINAEMAMLGSSKILGLPVFYTESRSDCEKIPSYTFKKIEDLFFTPMNRSKTFLIYAKHLFGLNILKKEKIKILNRLYHDELISSTIVYKGILNDYSICKHYNVESRSISIFELIRFDFYFSFTFLKLNLSISIFQKITIIIYQHLIILRKVITNKLVKINK